MSVFQESGHQVLWDYANDPASGYLEDKGNNETAADRGRMR
jgi:hypothetical protein